MDGRQPHRPQRARWAAPAPRRGRSCGSARVRPSTSSSPAKPGPANRRCFMRLITNLALLYSPDEVELVSRGLQERRGVQGVCRARSAARPRHCRGERTRVRPERSATARRGNEGSRRSLSGRSAPRTSTRIARPNRTYAAHVFCSLWTSFRSFSRRTTASPRTRPSYWTGWCARAAPSVCTSCSARRRWAAPTAWRGVRSIRWRSASRCSAAKRTPS